MIIDSKQSKNESNNLYKQLNSANLKGVLESFDIAYHGVRFKLNNDQIKYVFYPNHDLNSNRRFEDIAEKGDIVVKPAYSDTLKLIKKGNVLFFTFEKFNDEKDK